MKECIDMIERDYDQSVMYDDFQKYITNYIKS